MSIYKDVQRMADLHFLETDPRFSSDAPEIRMLVDSGLTPQEAVQHIIQKRERQRIREQLGNVFGNNWFGNSFLGKIANTVRDKWMLLD